jgi:cysteine-rich repeat protein
VRSIDTSALGNDGHLGSMQIKLGVIVPAGVTSGTLRFDDVALGSCGNCLVDAAAGETCDDGNALAGDGCSSSCEFECGNGEIETPEQCDDSNFTFGDSCTPSCRSVTTCDSCAEASCQVPVDGCLALTGLAQGGPSNGMPRSALCSRLRDCIHDSGCNLNTAIAHRPTLGGTPQNPLNPGQPENCYCGNSGMDCMLPGAANGSCRAEVEALLETDNAYQVVQRVGGYDPTFPGFDALADLLTCEQSQCSGQCVKAISCGNGFLEDRSHEFVAQFQFLIDRSPEPCLDEYTHTQGGCSFEECDDGNAENGDGCDEHCFLEACGNYLKQGLEECDDGNLIDGDGCDSSCIAEFVCGDAEVTPPFEECEPPSTGLGCSLQEYQDAPSTCGCDDTCNYKVCGNLLVQQGEECDPPNGTSCNDSCQRSVDECTECILLLDQSQDCPADLLLNGSGVPDAWQTGCLQEVTCMDLWGCLRDSLCHMERGFAACYCGEAADFNACESSSFMPTGVCEDEFLAAFEVQWGRPPTDNAELLAGFSEGPSNNNPYAAAIYIADLCLTPDSSVLYTPLRIQLEQSGVSPEVADGCVNACFP